MSTVDADTYLQLGDETLTDYGWKAAGGTTNRTNANGSQTNTTALVVDSITGFVIDDYAMCGTDGPARVRYVDPFTPALGLWDPLTCSDNDTVAERTIGNAAVTGLSFNTGTGALTGTPTVLGDTGELFFRITDADSLLGDSALYGISVIGAVVIGDNAKVIYELSDVSALVQWVDYIPVAVVADCVEGTSDEDGCWSVDPLASTSGKTAWVDYVPVYEVAKSANKWRYEADGWIPVNTLTP